MKFPCAFLPVIVFGCVSLAFGQNPVPATTNPPQVLNPFQQQFLQQFDLDRNGQLSPQENLMAQEAMRRAGINLGIAPGGSPSADQFAKQFDRDGDGKLSLAESATAQAMFQRMRNNGHGTRGGVQVGGGGSSAIPPQPFIPVAGDEKKPAKINPLVKRFDKDGDGKLNAEEKAAAQAELKKDKGKDKAEKKGK